MKSLPFAKIVPGGNPTIIVPASAVNPAQLGQTAQILMGSNHIEAEQVGSLAFTGTPSVLPHLQMMGGEFCVNATRACATLLANAGQLMADGHDCQAGFMSVSGSPDPILVTTAPTAELLRQTVTTIQEHEGSAQASSPLQQASLSTAPLTSRLPSFFKAPPKTQISWLKHIASPSLYAGARLSFPFDSAQLGKSGIFQQPEDGVTLVHLPGISHLLIAIGTNKFPTKEEAATEAARLRTQYGLEGLPALGTIWYSEKSSEANQAFAILPVVYVKTTNSLCLETACGSASLALALHACVSSEEYESRIRSEYAVFQPSGQALTVFIEKHSSNQCHAWVTGPAHIVGLGTAFV